MDILILHLDWSELSIKVSNLLLAVIAVISLVILITRHNGFFKNKKSTLVIDEVKLGIGNNSLTIHYDNTDREIAYKLWVEITTRKIGIVFEEDHDVINEVYNSWYLFFNVTRDLIKSIPIVHIVNGKGKTLVDISIDVLNNRIRPHLTTWQAKYRKWYEEKDKVGLSPQQIQREYEFYNEIVKEIKSINESMIEYKKVLYNIATK